MLSSLMIYFQQVKVLLIISKEGDSGWSWMAKAALCVPSVNILSTICLVDWKNIWTGTREVAQAFWQVSFHSEPRISLRFGFRPSRPTVAEELAKTGTANHYTLFTAPRFGGWDLSRQVHEGRRFWQIQSGNANNSELILQVFPPLWPWLDQSWISHHKCWLALLLEA